MNSATTSMIDGVKEACEAWGRALRWVMSENGDYPTMASFERARGGELDAKAVKVIRQRFGEVLVGDALVISKAIRYEPMMPEELHQVLFMHFVVPRVRILPDSTRCKVTVRQKAHELGYEDARAYYTVLEYGYHFLLGRITIGVPRRTNSAHNGITA